MAWSRGYPTVCHTLPGLCFSGSTCAHVEGFSRLYLMRLHTAAAPNAASVTTRHGTPFSSLHRCEDSLFSMAMMTKAQQCRHARVQCKEVVGVSDQGPRCLHKATWSLINHSWGCAKPRCCSDTCGGTRRAHLPDLLQPQRVRLRVRARLLPQREALHHPLRTPGTCFTRQTLPLPSAF